MGSTRAGSRVAADGLAPTDMDAISWSTARVAAALDIRNQRLRVLNHFSEEHRQCARVQCHQKRDVFLCENACNRVIAAVEVLDL